MGFYFMQPVQRGIDFLGLKVAVLPINVTGQHAFQMLTAEPSAVLSDVKALQCHQQCSAMSKHFSDVTQGLALASPCVLEQSERAAGPAKLAIMLHDYAQTAPHPTFHKSRREARAFCLCFWLVPVPVPSIQRHEVGQLEATCDYVATLVWLEAAMVGPVSFIF